jgi:hypothetical protein
MVDAKKGSAFEDNKGRKNKNSNTKLKLTVVIAIVCAVLHNVHVVTQFAVSSSHNTDMQAEAEMDSTLRQQQQQISKSSAVMIRLSSPNSQTQQQQLQRQHKWGRRRRRLLVIATAPRSIKYVVALWSQLECFTLDVDHVVLSGPLWSNTVLRDVVEQAKTSIPQFQQQHVTIDYTVHDNYRYDVGLWCDGLEHSGLLPPSDEELYGDNDKRNNVNRTNKSYHHPPFPYDEYGLINDSVFALRPFTRILETLTTKNVRMSSLSYSFFGPQMKFYGKEYYWLESVWRGFDRIGMETFMWHSCRYAGDPLFCPLKRGWQKKKCIIDNFERAMAYQFDDVQNETWGLFLADVRDQRMKRDGTHKTWVMNSVYWTHLVDKLGFPVAKVNQKTQIENFEIDERMKTCTKSIDWTSLKSIDFSNVKVN